MVWRVCLRVLGHVQDAEDTFQATFLVLARKASSVIKRESVGSFLYGVAYRTALEAKTIHARRRSREKQGEQMPHSEVMPADETDWRPWLDVELSRLPEKYRTPVVLCDLEGRTRKEAARQLRVPEGTLSSRLAMARRLLAKRLARYGLTLSGVALAAALAQDATSAHLPASLLLSTTKAVAGQVTLSSLVEVLVKGALQTMLLAKLKVAVGAAMVVAALGVSGLAYQAAAQPAPGIAERKLDSKPRSELEALRHENELLKLNLEVVLEKVRAQESELRTLRGQVKATANGKGVAVADFDNDGWPDVLVTQYLGARLFRNNGNGTSTDVTELRPDPLQEVEAALKAWREAPDQAAQRRAADKLEKALKKMREQLKKQTTSGK
jgi:RNA polymerase sigma factor (sigma-70 family)